MAGDETRAQALRSLLESAALRRSDLLKALLTYLFEQHEAGRSNDVTEYEIATRVLGRPEDFAPDTDSSVRTRMMALRKKLDEYNAGEGSQAAVRVEIPRGTYGLRFVAAQPSPAVPEPVVAPGPPRQIRVFVLGFVSALLMVAVVLLGRGAWQGRSDSELRKAWGPMLESGSSVVVALGTPISLFVRDFGQAPLPVGDPPFWIPVPDTPQFQQWYLRFQGHPAGPNAILHPNFHSPLWGDASAAAIVSRMLGAHGAGVEVVPSARIHPVALRDRNSVLIGRPEYSEAVAGMLPQDGLWVEYNSETRRMGIHNRAPRTGEPVWWSGANQRHNYGLITVLSFDTAGRKRMILFSGINSDGAEAGARFFTSPENLRTLDAQMQKAGLTAWPARYQVVVATESLDTYSIEAKFEFLRVLR